MASTINAECSATYVDALKIALVDTQATQHTEDPFAACAGATCADCHHGCCLELYFQGNNPSTLDIQPATCKANAKCGMLMTEPCSPKLLEGRHEVWPYVPCCAMHRGSCTLKLAAVTTSRLGL